MDAKPVANRHLFSNTALKMVMWGMTEDVKSPACARYSATASLWGALAFSSFASALDTAAVCQHCTAEAHYIAVQSTPGLLSQAADCPVRTTNFLVCGMVLGRLVHLFFVFGHDCFRAHGRVHVHRTRTHLDKLLRGVVFLKLCIPRVTCRLLASAAPHNPHEGRQQSSMDGGSRK